MASVSKGEYKKPHALNAVSIGLVLLLMAGGYWLYCFGPAYLGWRRSVNIVTETAHKFYKLRTLEQSVKAQETNRLVSQARADIVNILGFDDPELTVKMLLDETAKKVNVVAEYNHIVTLHGLNKQRILHFRAVGESDYEDTGL